MKVETSRSKPSPPASVSRFSAVLQGFSIDGNNRRHLLVNTIIPRDDLPQFSIPCYTYYRDDIASDGVTRTPFYAFSVDANRGAPQISSSAAPGSPASAVFLDEPGIRQSLR